ncbi:E3 SUMO-protein ligase ZBED1-like [Macrosteles quadrilineatus]|uniref:E3 SUMO-protein ligase ZBED1-like n=1 Tax=Macrosteles quadrilineatus TaxID=74068 RepID=UPI0023E0EA33|nr:E3 SUMO-protein ligase ZBED1-like [Macrosteles quadrilineatus]
MDEDVDDPAPVSSVRMEVEDRPSEAGPSTPANVGLPSGKNNTAIIWEYFTKVNEGKTTEKVHNYFAVCNLCQKSIKTAYGNTSGMRRHLENKHFPKFVLLKKKEEALDAEKFKTKISKTTKAKAVTQSKLTSTFKWSKDATKAKTITREIGKWMASSLHPYNLVDQEGFKSLMNTLEPHYTIPSPKTFSRTVIPGLYKEVHKSVEAGLAHCRANSSSLAITVDMWSSDSNNSFMSLTSHFMTEDFQIENFCLGCYAFIGDHKGWSIANKVSQYLEEWKINTMAIPIYAVTDNATNMKSAMSCVKPKLNVLSCFAHSLQLAINDAKKETPGVVELVKKVKGIVGHYRHSCQATERLHEVQASMNKPILQLIQDSETRWNSEYLMLDRFLKNKEPISRDIIQTGKLDNLTISEWKMVEGYVSILEPLFEATTQVCSAIVPTCSMVIPIIFGLSDSLDTFISQSIAKSGIGFARELLKAIKIRFPNNLKEDPYLTAMLVDPRFKTVILSAVEQDLALSKLKLKIQEILKKKSESDQAEVPVEPTSDESKPKSALWKAFAKAAAAKKHSTSESSARQEASIESELARFFNGEVIDQSDDPCKWWQDNANFFPLLRNVALQYLAIPATEVASERMFSSAGGVVAEKRQRLTSFHVEELVFLHQNKKLLK